MASFKKAHIPYGWFLAYVKAHAPLATICWGKTRERGSGSSAYQACYARYRQALKRHLESAVAGCPESESAVADAKFDPDNYHARFIYVQPREGAQYFERRWAFARDADRRRQIGGGRKRSATIIRELLMDWYSKIRHSVDCKIMCRFPKKCLLVKAQMLQEDYLVTCMKMNVQPELVDVGPRWLNELLSEYRISDRIPNRKFKVPRWVLGERLEIFWITVAKVRMLIILTFGYDPDCRT